MSAPDRELRRSLVDMDAFFDIMRTKSLLVDGHMSLCATHTHKLFDCGEDGAPQNGGRQECAGNFEDGMTVELCDVHFAYDNGRKVQAPPTAHRR